MQESIKVTDQQSKTQEHFKLSGFISSVEKREGWYKITSEVSRNVYLCFCKYGIPIHINDVITGIVEKKSTESGHMYMSFINEPYVEPSVDKESVCQFITSILGKRGLSYVGASRFYDYIEDVIRSNQDIHKTIDTVNELSSIKSVASYLNELSVAYNENREINLQNLEHILDRKNLCELLNDWYKHRSERRLLLLGIQKETIQKLRRTHDQCYTKCRINPYEVYEIPIEICNNICSKLGLQITESEIRIGQILRTIYENCMKRSWMCTPRQTLMTVYPDLQVYETAMISREIIFVIFDHFYLAEFWNVEHKLSECFTRKIRKNRVLPNFSDIEEKKIEASKNVIIPTFLRKTLNNEQKQAIFEALNNYFVIITGTAGTGKTTIIDEIRNNQALLDSKYVLLSYTGKAVARIKEAVLGSKPLTMHRFINCSVEEDIQMKIEDETSMITEEIEYDVIKKLDDTGDIKFIFIGDPNQLEPIGCGLLFEELLKLNYIKTKEDKFHVPVIRLTQILRQKRHLEGMDDGIVLNSSKLISSNHKVYTVFDETDNFSMITGGIQNIKSIIDTLYRNGIKGNEVTILSPYNEHLDELNAYCQGIFNGANRYVTFDGKFYYIGDRMMMKENNYNIDVMNGEEGEIVDFDTDNVKVKFRDIIVPFFLKNKEEMKSYYYNNRQNNKLITSYISIKDLQHSFAITVHKSQGSQWKYVIIYIPDKRSYSFINWKLLFTAITRAELSVYIVGDPKSIHEATKTEPSIRYQNLALLTQHKFRISEHEIVSLQNIEERMKQIST